MRFWSEIPTSLWIALFLSLVAAALVLADLIAQLRDARNSMLLSEWEARALKRDQFRTESRRRLRKLQARLGLRRAS